MADVAGSPGGSPTGGAPSPSPSGGSTTGGPILAPSTAGKPPRGYAPKPSTPSAPTAAAKPGAASPPASTSPTGTPSAQAVATGAKPAAPPAATAKRKEATPPPERTPDLVKYQLDDGSEIEIDVSDVLEERLKAYRRKMKVNHEEVDVTLDEMAEVFPLAKGAHQKYKEAAEIRAENERIKKGFERFQQLMSDPEQAAGQLAKMIGSEKLLTLAERVVNEQIRLDSMTPEQKAEAARREQMTAEDRKREDALRQREEKIKADEARLRTVKQTELAQKFSRDFPILLKNAGVEVNAESFKRMADLKAESIKLGIPVTDQQIAAQVAEEFNGRTAAYLKSLSPEALVKLLGEEGAAKINQINVERVASQPGRRTATRAKPAPSPMADVKTPDQMRAYLRRLDASNRIR